MPDQISLKKETNLYDDSAIAKINTMVQSTYGTCSTAAGTVAKVVTLTGFTLFTGARISVYFTYANTASNPTMNVNGTGAKAIWARGAAIVQTYYWAARSQYQFVYDGTHWVMDNAESQTEVFDRLTDGGAIHGIFMNNGQLYINMDYLQTGTLELGGVNNGNGLMVVYNASGAEIVRCDMDGIKQNRSNVYSYLGNAVVPRENLLEGYIDPITSAGLAVSYTDNLSNDVFSTVPKSDALYLTGLSSTKTIDVRLAGYAGNSRDTQATETLYHRITHFTNHTEELFWQLHSSDTSVSSDGMHYIYFYPGWFYGIERRKGVSGTGYGLIIDRENKIAIISSGVPSGSSNNYSALRALSGGKLLVQNDGSINVDSGSLTIANSKSLTLNSASGFYIPFDTNMFLKFGLSSGNEAGLFVEVGRGTSWVHYLQVKDGSFNLRISDTRFIQLLETAASGGNYFEVNAGNSLRFYTTITGTSNYWRIESTGRSGYIAVETVSSKRYKHDITDCICDGLDAHRLYNLRMKQFVYNDDCNKWEHADMKGVTLPGFIAEDVDEIYPAAVIHDGEGRVESWDERRIIPGMLKLIQEQHEEIEKLKQVIHVA